MCRSRNQSFRSKPVLRLRPAICGRGRFFGWRQFLRDITDIHATRPGTDLTAVFDRVFVKSEEIPRHKIGIVGSTAFDEKSSVMIKLMMVADRMHLQNVFCTKGTVMPVHVHPDHSTIVVLQQGRLKLTIDDKTYIAEPGDVWQHPRNVPHGHEALEDSYVIEIKSPAKKTW